MNPDINFSQPHLERFFHNSIRLDEPQFPFTDAFAQFSASFRANRALGLGVLHPRGVLSTYAVAEPSLEMWICDNENWLPMPRKTLDCWPWTARENGETPFGDGVLSACASHVFIDERTLKSRFELKSSTRCSPQIAFVGTVHGDTKHYMTPYFDGDLPRARETFVEVENRKIVCGLRNPAGENGLTNVAFRLGCDDENLQMWRGENPFWTQCSTDETTHFSAREGRFSYALHTPQSLVLGANQTAVFEFTTQFLPNDNDAVFLWPRVEKSDHDTDIEYSKQRFFRNLNVETLPKTGSKSLDFAIARARLGLLRDGLRGLDGEFGGHIASLCMADSSDFSCSFFWDSLFSSVALSGFHREASRGAIATVFTRQSDFDGSSPERKWNYGLPAKMFQQAPQSPVASWAVCEYLARENDDDFLDFIYPKLKRNHDFWERHSDMDGDGLAEYRWSGQAADNSPLWDSYSSLDKTTGCGWIPPVASVPLNCFIFKDAAHLELLARRIGNVEDAEHFAKRQQNIAAKLLEHCYVADENRFWDWNQLTRTHRRVKTFYMFWPLYARVPMTEKNARDLIENVLLDPKQFFGSVPFPSVAYDEPTYDASGYWRGRAWPHINYWLLETLSAYGYTTEANTAAQRILAWFAANGIRENLCSDANETHPRGFLDYNWGCAAFEMIASRRYLEVAPVCFVEK